jgi:hypothetical protein
MIDLLIGLNAPVEVDLEGIHLIHLSLSFTRKNVYNISF